MVALGWTGIAIPEQYGGFAMGLGSTVPVIESMGRHLLGTPLITSTLASQAILRGGSEAQREQWLPKVVAGHCGLYGPIGQRRLGRQALWCDG